MKLFDILFKRKNKKNNKTSTKHSAETASEEFATSGQIDSGETNPRDIKTDPVKASGAKRESSPRKDTPAKASAPTKSSDKKQPLASKNSVDKRGKVAAAPDVSQTSKQKESETVHTAKATRSGKFEIKKSKDGRYVFNLYASNNVIVATSQVYSSSSSAMNGIKSVITNAAAPIEDQTLKSYTALPYPKWEIYLDKGGQYRFRLNASNGSCVCHSQGYTSKVNCKKGIESIIKFAGDAEIKKAYLDKKDK